MSTSNEPVIVVVLAKTFPVPPDAGSPRPFHLLSGLGDRARLHCVAGVRQSEEEWDSFVQNPSLASLFETIQVRRGTPRDPRFAQPLTFLTGSSRHDLRFRDPKLLKSMQSLTAQIAREQGPLSFLCMGIDALQFVPPELWHCCVIDGVDAWSLILERRVRSGAELTLRRRVKLYLAQFGMRRLESRIFRHAHAVAYNSGVDIEYLRRRSPNAPIVRVIDGCDTGYFSPVHTDEVEERPYEIIFNGHMRYAPNLDGALHLADDIMPLIWQRRPDTKLYLVGPDPNRGLARYGNEGRIVATGFVDDVRPYLARAAVVVSALQFGTGMKNKLQAGLAMKKAMVVSSVTAEGFDGLEHDRHALIADDPAEFADAVCDLLEHPERRARLAEAGQQLIREHFSWEAALEALWGAVESCPRTTAH